MSGPKTAQYDIVGDLLADALARMADEREREREASRRAEAQRREYERRMRQAERDRLAVAQATAQEAEQRLARIERVAGAAAQVQRPAAPADNVDAIEAYARELSAEASRLQTALRDSLGEAAQRASAEALELFARPKTAAELLDAYVAQARAARPQAAADGPEQRRERALRVLGRLSNEAANSIPPDVEALMSEMIEAPSAVRAEALELELRLRVQRFNEEHARRQRDLEEARALLESLPDALATDAARQDLELVLAGLSALTDALRQRVREAIAAYRAELAEERRQGASRVLTNTLKDLGYATDGIENTLFVEGGVAHLNKAEWGDYYVRLRVDPREHTVNFNMVREREGGEAGDRRAADQAAENSWCDGLPQLLKTLEARGLPMKLQRHLAAGAMPVQVVEPGAIPDALKARADRTEAAPMARMMRPR